MSLYSFPIKHNSVANSQENNASFPTQTEHNQQMFSKIVLLVAAGLCGQGSFIMLIQVVE